MGIGEYICYSGEEGEMELFGGILEKKRLKDLKIIRQNIS